MMVRSHIFRGAGVRRFSAGLLAGMLVAAGLSVVSVAVTPPVSAQTPVRETVDPSAGHATAINSSGQFVGFKDGGLHYLAYRWDPNDGQKILDLPAGYVSSSAYGINDSGAVAGSVDNQDAVLWSAAGVPTVYPSLPGRSSSVWSVNASGTMAGSSYTSSTAPSAQHAVVWTPGQVQDIHPAGYDNSEARGINASGQVVGYAYNNGPCCPQTPFVKNSGQSAQLLPMLSGCASGQSGSAYAINVSGAIAGESQAADCQRHAVRWTPTDGAWTIQDLGATGEYSIGNSINDNGDIVGRTYAAQVMWVGTTRTTIDVLPEMAPANYILNSFINNAGDIVSSDYRFLGKASLSTVRPDTFVAAKVPLTLGPDPDYPDDVEDPVNAATGNFTHTKSLLSYPSFVYGMDLNATYNSMDTAASVLGLGVGWTSSLDVTLTEAPYAVTGSSAKTVWYRGPGGQRGWLTPNGANTWYAPEGKLAVIRRDPNTSKWVMQFRAGERWEFDSTGRLERKCQGVADWATRSDWTGTNWSSAASWCGATGTGQMVTVTWGATTPVSVASSTGMSQSFTYTSGVLTRVRGLDSTDTAQDRYVEFGYSGGQPSFISMPHFSSETTGFPTESFYITGKLVSYVVVTKLDGTSPWTPNTATSVIKAQNTYLANGRVSEQVNQSRDKITFTWDATAHTMTATNEATSQQVMYSHDNHNRLVAKKDPNAKNLSKGWSQGTGSAGAPLSLQVPSAKPTEVTDRTGAKSGVFYDAYGRVTQTAKTDPYSAFLPGRYDDASFANGSNLCQRKPDGSFPAPDSNASGTNGFTRPPPSNAAATMDCRGKRFAVESYTYVAGSVGSQLDTYTNAVGAVTKYTYTATSLLPATTTVGYNSTDSTVPAVTTTVESSNNRIDAAGTAGVVTCNFYNTIGQLTATGLLPVAVVSGHTMTQDCAAHQNDTGFAKTTYTYTALGLQATVTKPAPQGTTTYTYYGTGQLHTVADPIAGHAPITYAYAPTGETISVTDELGKATTTTVAYNVTDQTVCNGGIAGSGGSDPDGNPVVTPCKIVTTQPPSPAAATTTIFDRTGNQRLTATPTGTGGARTWNIYANLGRLTKTVDATGVASKTTYDDNGRVTGVQAGTETGTAATDATATTTFDLRGRAASRTTAKNDAGTVTTLYSYDQTDRVIQELLPSATGFLPSRPYSDTTPTACQQLPDGTYPAPKVLTGFVRPNGASASADCTANDFKMSLTVYGPTGAVKQTGLYRSDVSAGPGTQATVVNTYDSAGRSICVDTRVTAATGYETETHTFQATDFDPVTGFVIKRRVPIAAVSGCADSPTDTTKWAISASGYNPDGSINWSQTPVQYKAVPDPNSTGHINYRTSLGYDLAGRKTTVWSPDPSNPGGGTVTATTCYTARGEVAKQIDGGGGVIANTYMDAAGTLQSVTDPNGMVYNAANPCASAPLDNKTGVTTFGYDGRRNRVTRQTWADLATSKTETWGFDGANRPTSYTTSGANPVTWTTAYSTFQHVAGVWTDTGRRTFQTTQTGAVADASLRQTLQRFAPSGSVLTVESDLCGTAACPSQQANITDSDCYSMASAAVCTAIKTAYDPLGRRKTVTDTSPGVTANNQYQLAYNTAGNITALTYPNGVTSTVQWNLSGQAIQHRYPDTTLFRYNYDSRLALTGVDVAVYPSWFNLSSYTRDPNGQPLVETLTGASPGSRTWTRNSATDTTDKYTQTLQGATAVTTPVTYDKNGRVRSDCKATGTGGVCQSTDIQTTYDYDNAGQLKNAGVANDTAAGKITNWAYTYGNRGNRLTQTVTKNGSPTATTNYTWNADLSQLTGAASSTGGDNATTTYDAAGRRTSTVGPGGTFNYTYSPRGALAATAFTPPGGSTTTQTNGYDPLGQWNCSTLNPATNCAGTPNTSNDFFYWDTTGATGGVPQILQWSSAGTNYRYVYGAERVTLWGYYFSNDYLGSTLAGPADTAAPTGYSPYGEPIGGSGGINQFQYRGELKNINNLHLRARNYEPATGTFTTRDPLPGVDGTTTAANPYHYSDNDPLNKTDPTGERPTDWNLAFTGPDPQVAAVCAQMFGIAGFLQSTGMLWLLDQCFKNGVSPGAPIPTTTTTTTSAPTPDQLLMAYAGEVSKHWNWAAAGISIASDCDTNALCSGAWGLFGPPPDKTFHVSASQLLSPSSDRNKAYYTVAHEIAHGATYSITAMKCTFSGNNASPCNGDAAGLTKALNDKDPGWRQKLVPDSATLTWPFKKNNTPEQLAVERIADCIAQSWGAQPSWNNYWSFNACPSNAESLAVKFIE